MNMLLIGGAKRKTKRTASSKRHARVNRTASKQRKCKGSKVKDPISGYCRKRRIAKKSSSKKQRSSSSHYGRSRSRSSSLHQVRRDSGGYGWRNLSKERLHKLFRGFSS